MGLTETEFGIIKIIAEIREASSGMIASRAMMTSGYSEYLCKYLVKKGYLELTDRGAYCLSPKGREALTGKTYQPLWDKKTIQAMALELAKQLAQTGTFSFKKAQGLQRPSLPQEPTRAEIKIKESFVDPFDEEVAIRYKPTKKPKENRISGMSIKKSLEALKRLAQ